MTNEVCIVDYGVGNISTLTSLIGNAGLQYVVSSDPSRIGSSSTIVLAGVGAFDFGMTKLNEQKITPTLREIAKNPRQKIVGICLGMQLLFERSEEGSTKGLGVFSGVCNRFPNVYNQTNLRIPHMGWSLIKRTTHTTGISERFDNHRFYFVHSYFVTPADPKMVKYYSEYGVKFPAIVEQDNITGVQFHPEKSSRQGRALLMEILKS